MDICTIGQIFVLLKWSKTKIVKETKLERDVASPMSLPNWVIGNFGKIIRFHTLKNVLRLILDTSSSPLFHKFALSLRGTCA